jgi:predicted nucleic acid-binding protein
VKTYIFDASALFAYLQDRTPARKVNQVLREAFRGHSEVLMSVVNYGEVYNLILRNAGPDRASATMQRLSNLPIQLMDVTLRRALHAAEVKFTYKLHDVDSFAAALAIEHKSTLVTSDSDFRRLGHGFHVLWLKA